MEEFFTANNQRRLKLAELDNLAELDLTVDNLVSKLQKGQTRELRLNGQCLILHLDEFDVDFIWDRHDPRTAVACLVAFGQYEPNETKFLLRLVQDCSTVFDVGANVGYYSVLLAKHLGTNGKIYAFEPVPQTFQCLSQNIGINDLTDVVYPFQLAISGQIRPDMELHIPLISGSSAASSLNLHPDEVSVKTLVSSTTLDAFVEDHKLTSVDLIKIDVEGAEKFVLEGAQKTISEFKPYIFLELLRKWSLAYGYHPQEVVNELRAQGYGCFGISNSLKKISIIDQDTVETNFLFVHLDNPKIPDLMSLLSEGL
jgi:FkbM family methyltransferase